MIVVVVAVGAGSALAGFTVAARAYRRHVAKLTGEMRLLVRALADQYPGGK